MPAQYPAITQPTTDPASLRTATMQLKELAETVTNQRGAPGLSAVTWNDLIRLGLAKASDIPSRNG